MKVTILTLGCRVNQSESDLIQGTLKENGITIVDLREIPDVCVINTCSVTAKSDYTSKQLIRKAVRTGAKVVVTGCYSHFKKDEVRSISSDIEIVDNELKHKIADIITGKESGLVFSNFSRSRPQLKVQDGCNFRCSYCAVPFARGRSRSLPLHEVINRVQAIESAGYNEVVLTGIHLGSYGQDLACKTSLNQLIKDIIKLSNMKRIRLSSIEINEIDYELIELMQDNRLCSHLHIPLQSGSDQILKLMRRNYKLNDFSSKLNKIFSKVKNVSVGSDIIVGFPGEGEKEFMSTYNFLASYPFSYLHIFPFSVRPDTPASRMKDRVQSNIIKERLDILIELSRKNRRDYLQRQLHKILDVIIEESVNEGHAAGTSGNYIKVSSRSGKAKKRSIVHVKILEATDSLLKGFIIP